MGVSLRSAINEHCKACGHDPLSGLGHWRIQVQGCTATGCHLWPVRPRSSVSKGGDV